jgi:DNA-binding response OmpR family regulator
MMPGASGLEVLKRLRTLGHRKTVPVIILTAKGQDTDRTEAFSLGANEFVTKPFSPKKLLARIDEILEAPR